MCSTPSILEPKILIEKKKKERMRKAIRGDPEAGQKKKKKFLIWRRLPGGLQVLQYINKSYNYVVKYV